MKILLVFGILSFSFATQASYLENCIYEVHVVSLGRFGSLNKTLKTGEISKGIIVKLEKVLEDRGSHGGCDHRLKTLQPLMVEENLDFKVGHILRLEHVYSHLQSSSGSIESDTWQLITQRDFYH